MKAQFGQFAIRRDTRWFYIVYNIYDEDIKIKILFWVAKGCDSFSYFIHW